METKLKIILATDYSESVMNAERYAIQFAKSTKSILTILHVYDIPFSLPIGHSEYAKAAEEMRIHELQRLEQHYTRLLASLDIHPNEINCECLVLEGVVGKQIRKEAEQSHTDIIITGTHEVMGFRRLLPRSRTWDVIKKSNVPVLAIPKDALFTPIKSIVFAAEYREGEIPGIKFLAKIAKQLDSELIILHVSKNPFSKELEAIIQKKFKEEVHHKISYDKLSLHIAHHEDIVEGLNQFCIASETDWLVMSHARPFFLESILIPSASTTKEMSFNTHTPLFTVPDFYDFEKENINSSDTDAIIND